MTTNILMAFLWTVFAGYCAFSGAPEYMVFFGVALAAACGIANSIIRAIEARP